MRRGRLTLARAPKDEVRGRSQQHPDNGAARATCPVSYFAGICHISDRMPLHHRSRRSIPYRARRTVVIMGVLTLCSAPCMAQAPLVGDVSAQERPITASITTRATSAVTARAGDSLRNGTLIGTAVGFAAGFIGLAAFNADQTASGPIWDREALGYYTGAGLLGAGIGAGLGAVIDALNKQDQSVFPKSRLTIRPVLGRHRRAVAASLRF